MKKQTLLLLACLSVFYSTNPQAKEELVVRINENAYPSGFKNALGWHGMDVDVLNELMSDTDLKYKVILMPFKRAMTEIAEGRIDLIANLTKSQQRSEYMFWIGPLRTTKVGLVVLKSNQGTTINNIDELISILELKQQQIGHVIGVSYSPFLDDILEHNTQFNGHIWKSATRRQIIEMLHKDRIFGFFQDEFEARSLMAANKDGHINAYSEFVIRESTIDNALSGAYFGVSKHLEQTTIDKLNRAFQQMQQDGRLQKITEKWSSNQSVVGIEDN